MEEAEEDEIKVDVEVELDNTGDISDSVSPEKDKHEEKSLKEIQTVSFLKSSLMSCTTLSTSEKLWYVLISFQ